MMISTIATRASSSKLQTAVALSRRSVGLVRHCSGTIPSPGDGCHNARNRNRNQNKIKNKNTNTNKIRNRTTRIRNYGSATPCKRWYSSSNRAADKKGSEELHSFFREQMMELNREQRQFGPIDETESDSDSESDVYPSSHGISGSGSGNQFHQSGNDGSSGGSGTASSFSSSSSSSSSHDLADQLDDWKAEQVQVFGSHLADAESGADGTPTSTVSPFGNHDSGNHELDVDRELDVELELELELEDRLSEREARYEFTPEERAAWGRPPPDPEDMQTILDQVAHQRRAEIEYSSTASLSPTETPTVATVEHSVAAESISASASAFASASASETSGDYYQQKKQQQQQQQQQQHHESFSHVSADGEGVHMVDVGHKAVTTRTAHARSEVWLPPEVLEAFLPSSASATRSTTAAGNGTGNGTGTGGGGGGAAAATTSGTELVGPKGPIFATAKIAGIVAAKKTSDLIPLCHPLPLDQVKLDIRLLDSGRGSDRDSDSDSEATVSPHDSDTAGGGTVVIDCTCKVTHKTGVEMEALTGATVAALTIYDMTKAVSHNIRIESTRLIGKTGGKRTVLDGTETTTTPATTTTTSSTSSSTGARRQQRTGTI